MFNQDYLQHYGVLGMKWGVHRARRYAQKATSAKARGNKEKAAKYSAKSKKIRAYHNRMAGGKEVADRVEKQSLGKTLAQAMVFGTYGAAKYNEVRAKGYGRAEGAVAGVLGYIGNQLTGGFGSVIEPRLKK